jgi:hypothetical protein
MATKGDAPDPGAEAGAGPPPPQDEGHRRDHDEVADVDERDHGVVPARPGRVVQALLQPARRQGAEDELVHPDRFDDVQGQPEVVHRARHDPVTQRLVDRGRQPVGQQNPAQRQPDLPHLGQRAAPPRGLQLDSRQLDSRRSGSHVLMLGRYPPAAPRNPADAPDTHRDAGPFDP